MITKKIELFEEEKVLKCGHSPSFDLASFPGVEKVSPPRSKSNEPAPCATSKTISVTPACLFHPGFMRRLFPLTGSERSESRRQTWKIADANNGERMEGGGGGRGGMDGRTDERRLGSALWENRGQINCSGCRNYNCTSGLLFISSAACTLTSV